MLQYNRKIVNQKTLDRHNPLMDTESLRVRKITV